MKYERFDASRGGETKELDPQAKYETALAKYFWGMTPLEIAGDGTFKKRLFETIERFGGYDHPIDRTGKIVKDIKFPGRGTYTIEEHIDAARKNEPEYAEVLDSAIDVQQLLFVEDKKPTEAHLVEKLMAPINSSSLGWSVEEAAAIKQTGYSTIDRLALEDDSLARDIEIFSNNFRRLTKDNAMKEPVFKNQKRASRKTKLLLEVLREKQAAIQKTGRGEVTNSLAEINAAIAVGSLDERVRKENSVPRIARETYVDYLAGALYFRQYPEDVYVREEKGKKVKVEVPPMSILRKSAHHSK